MGYSYQGRLSTVGGSEPRLKLFEDVVMEVGSELCRNYFLKHFRKEREVRDAPVAIKISRVGFSKRGAIKAVLTTSTRSSACKQKLLTLAKREPMAPMLACTRAVGKGSSTQVEFFIPPMIRSTSCCVVWEKQQRGWEISGCGITARAGGGTEPGRKERMPSTSAPKESLHYFSPDALCTIVGGLRRLCTVEKSCLELQRLSLMRMESNQGRTTFIALECDFWCSLSTTHSQWAQMPKNAATQQLSCSESAQISKARLDLNFIIWATLLLYRKDRKSFMRRGTSGGTPLLLYLLVNGKLWKGAQLPFWRLLSSPL